MCKPGKNENNIEERGENRREEYIPGRSVSAPAFPSPLFTVLEKVHLFRRDSPNY